ncbi:hypothetical protein HDV64DRAFT_7488 [Trichoderma sp. TUCIM 5745]
MGFVICWAKHALTFLRLFTKGVELACVIYIPWYVYDSTNGVYMLKIGYSLLSIGSINKEQTILMHNDITFARDNQVCFNYKRHKSFNSEDGDCSQVISDSRLGQPINITYTHTNVKSFNKQSKYNSSPTLSKRNNHKKKSKNTSIMQRRR